MRQFEPIQCANVISTTEKYNGSPFLKKMVVGLISTTYDCSSIHLSVFS